MKKVCIPDMTVPYLVYTPSPFPGSRNPSKSYRKAQSGANTSQGISHVMRFCEHPAQLPLENNIHNIRLDTLPQIFLSSIPLRRGQENRLLLLFVNPTLQSYTSSSQHAQQKQAKPNRANAQTAYEPA